MSGMGSRRKVQRFGAAIAAAVIVVAVGVFAWTSGAGNGEQFSQLDPAESLAATHDVDATEPGAVSAEAAATRALRYEQASAEKFADIMHIEDGAGNALTLDQVPASDYAGFMFELADGAGATGDAADATAIAAKAAEAAASGAIEQVHGNLYRADSLDTVAALFGADQLSYIEPDFRMHLIGDVDDQTEGAGSLADGGDAAITREEELAARAALGTDAEGAPASQPAQDAFAAQGAPALEAQGGTDANPAPDWPLDDAEFQAGKLYHLDKLNIQGAWQAGLDGSSYYYNGKPLHADADGNETPVKVAVIDTGLYGTGANEPEHEDLNYDHMLSGYDFIHDTAETTPDAQGHGTFVAGLIAAKANNGVGVAGLMPETTIVSEKVFDTGSASTSDVISGIYHAVDVDGVDVINMSLGGEYNERTLEVACDYAVDAGVLVVASAGNDGVSTPNYPAAYDSVVGVASINSADARSTWSQYGASVFVTAYGEAVTSTYIEGATSYKTASGTSFSGPEVAALAAMCKSVYPDIDQDTFKQFLIETSTDMGTKGYDDYFGWGRVDFAKIAETVLASQVLPYYDISFDVLDESGAAVEGAAVVLEAAEDIAWDADEENGVAAGSWPEGMQIDPAAGNWAEGKPDPAAGAYRLHRGSYRYTVVADGKYTVEGQFKTYTQDQAVKVVMPAAYQTSIAVVDSAGAPVPGASLAITSTAGRAESPKATDEAAAKRVFDLASGAYAYEAAAEGYVTSAGALMVQRTASERTVALYKEGELAYVSFDCVDAADGTPVPGKPAIVVYDESGNAVNAAESGQYRLAKGHAYTAAASKAGYEDVRYEFTVGEAASQIVTVSMTKARAVVTFDVYDESGKPVETAQVKVADASGEQMPANAANPLKFNLNAGRYSYQVEAPGYDTVERGFTVTTESFTVDVQLAARAQKVTFAVTDAATGQAIEGAAVKVSQAGMLRAIAANADGSYSLTPGAYTYTVYKDGYTVASADFEVAGADVRLDVALAARAAGAEGFDSGSGTADDPYVIANEEQLRYLAEQTAIVRMTKTDAPTNKKGEVGGYYKLANDIELHGEWTPIGNYENSSNAIAFTGSFDGAGHTVSGISISNTYDAQGLFGYVYGATIENLVVEGSILCDGRNATAGGAYVGGIVGYVRGQNDSLYTSGNTGPTTIRRCISRVDVTGRAFVGGIAGSAQVAFDSTGLPDALLSDYSVNIEECGNEGNVTAAYHGECTRNALSAGGIVGSAKLVGITSCYSAGRIQAGYTAGGIIARGDYTGIFSCYSSGQVTQYVGGSGYANMTGALVGVSAKTNASDSYALERDDNYYNALVGSNDSVSSFPAATTGMVEYADAYRTDGFVAKVNADSLNDSVRTAFVVGRDFPLLAWQVGEGTLLAPMPHVVVQPQGVTAANPYRQGDAAAALTAEVEPVSEGALTWQWYVSERADGGDAQAIAGAAGAGEKAAYVPDTAERGVKYYFAAFSNTVDRDLVESDVATARTNVAAVYVRSATDAEKPQITALNPNQTSEFNTSLTVTQAADLEMEVRASVADGGVLAYQWYKADEPTGGTAIAGATKPTYDVDTAQIGTVYYYVEVTNTTEPGNSQTVTSDWITVKVEANTISSYEQLASFRDRVNSGTSYAGLTITLDTDIAIPEGVDWEPIGTREHPFAGTFQGSAARLEGGEVHKVTGLSVNGYAHDSRYLGLFGFTYGASIHNVQVAGTVTGAANTYVGLLVGYAYAGTNSSAAITNCGTLAGSSVEGKYQIGGLVGYNTVYLRNCANHADVHARAYVKGADDAESSSVDFKAVGGLVGRSGGGIIFWSYNTGTVTVDAPAAGEVCASVAGGVAGYASSSSALVSCYNHGAIEPAAVASNIVDEPGKVRYAGSVAGYMVAGANLHYLEGTYASGAHGSLGEEFASLHSAQFVNTQYFADMLNMGYASYMTSQFQKSKGGSPHLMWEEDDSTAPTEVRSAEPWINDLEWSDFENITSTWAATLYQGFTYSPIYTLADSPDGGTLTFEWQMRDPSALEGALEEARAAAEQAGEDPDAVDADDLLWETVADSATVVTAADRGEGVVAARAGYTFPTDTAGTLEYRAIVTNERDDATADDPAEPMQFVTPGIEVTVLSGENVLQKADPAAPSSADNPWQVGNAAQLALLADIVNGDAPAFPGMASSAFKGEYVQLADDIDLSGYVNWAPIGQDDAGYHKADFQGTFDGAGHTVSGLTITDDAALSGYGFKGLFGAVYGATIENLAVEGAISLEGGNAWAIGGVAGYAVNSSFENVVNRVDVTAHDSFGGICGYVGGTTFADCENAGAITINESSRAATYGQRGIAGIVGRSFDTRVTTLANCYNSGLVTARSGADGEYYFGAVAGSGSYSLTNCYYAAGSAVDADGGAYEPTGRGGSAAGPAKDRAGNVEAVDVPAAAQATAWSLNTAAGSKPTTGRWGAFALGASGAEGAEGESADDAPADVHLALGDAAHVLYRVDASSESALITVTPEYASAGDTVSASWTSKPGFEVKSVSWKPASADDAATTLLGEGASSEEAVTFAMPADDVAFVVEAGQDKRHRYSVAAKLAYEGADAPASMGAVQAKTLFDEGALAGEQVGLTIAVADGYQVRDIVIEGQFGTPVGAERIDGLHYFFAMPAENVSVTVNLEDAGAPASEQAGSLEITEAALHYRHSDAPYNDGNLLYGTVAFSGSYFGEEIFLMASELEQMGRAASSYHLDLYEQEYTFADGSSHRFTGHGLAALVKRLNGYAVIADDVPVRIEFADGTAATYTYGEIASLSYSAYADTTGQPTTRGLPVLLYYGADGAPNLDGAVGVVFGQAGAGDDNAARTKAGVTRICVGDDVNYSQHVWGGYDDMDAISGGTANLTMGYTDLTVRVYKGADASGTLLSERVMSLPEIEALAREDRGGIQHGTYSTVLYEDRETASDGPYADYYEGYDLMKLLEAMGVSYVDKDAAAATKVQFYQTGINGLAKSYKTVNVTLDYLAGNGDAGKGDYSGNFMQYVTGSDGTTPPGSGRITGLKPMLVYGKNGLPLVWSSGQVSPYSAAYNYRGPMMVLLPQNEAEGGDHVGGQTATACYLALIDVYVPEDVDYPGEPATAESVAALAGDVGAAEKALAAGGGVKASVDGSDVSKDGLWVPADVLDDLNAAISYAKQVAGNAFATKGEVDSAANGLARALAAFQKAQQPGTKANTNLVVPGASSKKANPMTVKAKTVKVKASKVKKKAVKVKKAKAFKVKNAQGKVTFAKVSGKAKIKVAANGKITVKKGLKKGTYKVKVRVSAAGNATYAASSKTVTVKVKVK